jgi:pimeloyl-ACP methyl ester carboxylesterase
MPFIQRDGVRIYYNAVGEGPAILLTNGYNLTSYMWRGLVDALSDRYRLITWDVRGHGRSDSPTGSGAYSQTLTLGDMAAILDAEGVREAILAGHSMGGYLSLAFHVEHPARVRALILIGTGPGYRNAKARDGWNRHAEGRARYFEKHGIENLGEFEGHGGENRSARGLALAARGIMTQHDSRVIDSVAKIRIPTLVITGTEDVDFLRGMEYLAARIPGARKILLPDAGHLPNIEQPRAFNGTVRQFLGQLDPQDSPRAAAVDPSKPTGAKRRGKVATGTGPQPG